MKQILRRLRLLLGSRRRLARLNHLLIPEKKPERDRLRRRLRWQILAPVFLFHGSLSREGRGVMLLTLLVGVAGVDVGETQVHLLFAVLAGVLLGSLAIRPFFRARGVGVRVETTPRVSVGEAQRFTVQLDNTSERAALALRVLLPFLPWDGSWSRPPAGVARVRPGERVSVVAEARFSARGEHHLDAFEVAALVPLGLAVGPRRLSDGPRFLVVPRIANVRDVRLRHRAPDRLVGTVLSKVAGESDIAGVRPYRAGDPLRHLHARTWARTGTPHIVTYQAEQAERVGLALVLDGDDATDDLKESAISLAAGVAAALIQRSSGVDLLLIDDKAGKVSPRTGRNALDSILDRLATHVLRDDAALSAHALEEVAPTLSALVLITASDALAPTVETLRARGLPVRWLRVVDGAGEASASAEDPRELRVSSRTIDRGEAIAA